MNVRDPFGLHPRAIGGKGSTVSALSILRSAATQAATDIREKAVEVVAEGLDKLEKGRQAIVEEVVEDMSFTVPKNVPSFSNPQRQIEDRLWSSSGVTAKHRQGQGVLGGVQGRVEGLFNPNRGALPMYKDKPYAYAPSGRVRPIYRRKRVCGLLGLVVLVMLWWTGMFAEHHEKAVTKLGQWGWVSSDMKAKGKVDWLKRRERVVEAMELSWGAYERYAWGRLPRNSCGLAGC